MFFGFKNELRRKQIRLCCKNFIPKSVEASEPKTFFFPNQDFSNLKLNVFSPIQKSERELRPLSQKTIFPTKILPSSWKDWKELQSQIKNVLCSIKALANGASSSISKALDGSTYPRWKMACFAWKIKCLGWAKRSRLSSGTSAAI